MKHFVMCQGPQGTIAFVWDILMAYWSACKINGMIRAWLTNWRVQLSPPVFISWKLTFPWLKDFNFLLTCIFCCTFLLNFNFLGEGYWLRGGTQRSFQGIWQGSEWLYLCCRGKQHISIFNAILFLDL